MGQQAMFTCTVTGSLFWTRNNAPIITFSPQTSSIILSNPVENAMAVLISNVNEVRTSVLILDLIPSAEFTIGCNNQNRVVKFSGMCIIVQ